MIAVSKAVEVAKTVSTNPSITQGGFDWSAAGAWMIFIAVIGVIIRQVGPWRQIFNDREAKFIESLTKRLEAVESSLKSEQGEREAERRRHQAERAVDRHRLNNVTQCFDALLLMLKRSPDKVTEIIRDIEEMRARQLQAEALEKAAIHAAGIHVAEEGQEP
jgi:hypothetical protein